MNRLISTFMLGVLLLGAWTARAQEDPNCAGAPMPRLLIGAQARVLPGDANNVRDSASRSGALVGSIPGGEIFDVLDGPTCADGFNWWQIEYGDVTGWTVEGSGEEYWVEPYEAPTIEAEPTIEPTIAPEPDTPVPSFEPPIAAINVLEVGAQVRVLNDDPDSETITLTVRAEPGRNGAPAAQALEGDLLIIIGGPEEVDGLRWWQVETAGGTEGWVVEGLVNADRDDAYERTLLAVCPAEGERLTLRFGDYIVTTGLDGSDPCVLDYISVSAWTTFSHTTFGFDNRFVPSPDGEYVLYTDGMYGAEGNSTLYRLNRDGSERLALTDNMNVYWAAWSPDGQRIAIANGQQIAMMRPDGSSYGVLAQEGAIYSWVGWLPDSETIVYAEQSRWQDQMGTAIEYAFYRINILEGGLREILRTMLDISSNPQISPDGSTLAIGGLEYSLIDGMSGNTPVQFYDEVLGVVIQFIDLETDELVVASDEFFYITTWLPNGRGILVSDSYVLPANGGDPYVVEFSDDLPETWRFIGWESDTVFLGYVGYGFEIEPDDYGIWAVDVTTGQVERRM